jgi:hypothetical protein
MPVVKFIIVPAVIGGKLRSSVLSVGKDSTVCAMNIEESSLGFIFTGHGHISSIHWRSADDVLLVQSEKLHVWYLKTGHLDRVVADKLEIANILKGCDYTDLVNGNFISEINFRRTLVAFSKNTSCIYK